MTRFLDFFTFFVYVSDDYVTFFRFRWIFFKFVDVSDILVTFDNFTCCSVITCPVTLFVDLTYFVVTCWYQFVCLTFEFDFFWTVIYNCIVVFTYWLIFFICYRCFDCVTFSVYVVNIYITLRLYWLFFKLVNVSYILIAFDNFTCCSVITCPVTLFVDLTYFVVTCWYQFVCLTFEFDFFWTVIYNCIVVFTYWLCQFICYRCFNCLTFSVYIVNVNITLRLCWLFFEFVDVSNVFTSFDNLTCCSV